MIWISFYALYFLTQLKGKWSLPLQQFLMVNEWFSQVIVHSNKISKRNDSIINEYFIPVEEPANYSEQTKSLHSLTETATN